MTIKKILMTCLLSLAHNSLADCAENYKNISKENLEEILPILKLTINDQNKQNCINEITKILIPELKYMRIIIIWKPAMQLMENIAQELCSKAINEAQNSDISEEIEKCISAKL
jgi:hypothetical protein